MSLPTDKHGHDFTTSEGLALQRTRFAGERTLMAWVRTSFSMITFGFSLVKFFQVLEKGNTEGADVGTHYLGLVMILVGIAAVTVGIVEHWGLLKTLHATDGSRRTSPALYIGLVVGVLGISALSVAMLRVRGGP